MPTAVAMGMGGSSRLIQIALVFVVLASAITLRLCKLQLGQHDFWELEAVKARTRKQTIGFRRGALLDCAGLPLATHRVTDDLAFVFGHFRKGSAAGQLLSSHYLLTGGRGSVTDALTHPLPWLDRFAALTVGELRSIEPGQRREDLLWYATWLVGDEQIKELVLHLRNAADGELACPRLLQEHAAILDRVRQEALTLQLLGRSLALADGTLAARIDDAIAALDRRVVRALGMREATTQIYESERELHRDLDYGEALLVADVPHAAVFDLAADPRRLPGVIVRESVRRVYPLENDVCPLLIGRVGLASKEAIDATEAARDERNHLLLEQAPTVEQAARLNALDELLASDAIEPDEEIGKEGLEASFEAVLRGRRGFRRTENDRGGRVQEVLEVVPPVPGADVTLTLDARLQQAAERVLARGVAKKDDPTRRLYPAAFALIELPAMQVRVVASWPAPTRAQIATSYAELAADSVTRPLHPRAWKPWQPPPPGSSVKPIVAAFALTAGVITPQTQLPCTKSELRAPGESKPVLCESNHGLVDVHEALVGSCNHFFAQVAYESGSERMVDWLRAVGFGRATGFTAAQLADGTAIESVGGEVRGNLERERGGRNLMLLGLGQGKVDGTPLQLAAAIGALALRRWQPPTLIERVGEQRPLRPDPQPLAISASAWETVVAAMRGVTKPGGTASPSHGADLSGFDLATKTGTPQQAGSSLSHSWLVGFFPSRAPRYAFALFVERSGMHGGEASAPLLLEILQQEAFAEVAAAARPAPVHATTNETVNETVNETPAVDGAVK